jgi:pheromone shutdown-related protein TraB
MTESYKNILIIGTSHIARQSINDIKNQFSELDPDIVCVELDPKRLHALLTDAKPDYSLAGIRTYGLQGYLFAVIGGFIQKKLGNVVGIKPGSDMLTAINLARDNKKQLMLIDQDIDITLRRFSKEFTFKEKMRLVWDIIRSPFAPKMKINLNEVPQEKLIEQMIGQLRDRYPSLYNILIHERNVVMAKNIYNIMNKNSDKKIMIIIGAGHEKDLLKLVKKEEYKRDKII